MVHGVHVEAPTGAFGRSLEDTPGVRSRMLPRAPSPVDVHSWEEHHCEQVIHKGRNHIQAPRSTNEYTTPDLLPVQKTTVCHGSMNESFGSCHHGLVDCTHLTDGEERGIL